MYVLEKTHWWFSAKRNLIKQLIAHFCPNPPNLKVLDLGCGTGAMLEELEAFGSPFGIDDSLNALPALQAKGIKMIALMQAEQLGFKDKTFDIIIALDVLEHICDDRSALNEIKRVLKDQGLCIITVPAYQFLWSYHDEALRHLRRYSKRELQKKVLSLKMDIAFLSYFYFLTFPLFILFRLVKSGIRSTKQPLKSDTFQMPEPINKLLTHMMNFELLCLQKIRFPCGSSLVCVARK